MSPRRTMTKLEAQVSASILEKAASMARTGDPKEIRRAAALARLQATELERIAKAAQEPGL